MTFGFKLGTEEHKISLERAAMLGDIEKRIQLAISEAIGFAEARLDRLRYHLERRAQLSIAETTAFVEDRMTAHTSLYGVLSEKVAVIERDIAALTEQTEISQISKQAFAEAMASFSAAESSVSDVRKQVEALFVHIERRVQLGVAEGKANAGDEAAGNRAALGEQIQGAVSAALAQFERQLGVLRDEVEEVRHVATKVPANLAEGVVLSTTSSSYLASPGHNLTVANWSPPLAWELETSGTDETDVELVRALSELGNEVFCSKERNQNASQALAAFPIGRIGKNRDDKILIGFDCWTSGIPQDAVDWINSNLAAVTCASSHAERSLIDHGCSVPTATIGRGIDQWERTACDPAYRGPGKAFRFLHMSDCGHAQGLDVLLDSFGRVFADDDDVSLIIMPKGVMAVDIVTLIEERRRANSVYPDVVVIENELTTAQMKALYVQCHVFVAPARGEGFGLTIAMAFLSGLPVIATAWGGHLDYCSSENSWLLDYAFTQAVSPFGVLASIWAEPSIKVLDQALWLAYRAEPAERFSKAWAGRKALIDGFTWKDTALRLVSLANRAGSSPKASWRMQKVGFVTSWNTKCGIASYVGHMLERIDPADYVVFADKTDALVREDGRNCIRFWTQSPFNSNQIGEIWPYLQTCSVGVLVIQVNWGFFMPGEFAHLIDGCQQRGVAVIAELHSTVDPPQNILPNRRLADFAPALRGCHRVLGHSAADLNRLKAVGVVDNLALFPLGIKVANRNVSASRSIRAVPQIMSFGFALPHKGLVQLVQAVGLLKRSGHSVKLQMLNSEYPASVSTQEIANVRAVIRKYELEHEVELDAKYLSDEECVGRLSAGDLIVYPYQETGESASAAVRFGLACHVPVLVTPLPIFDDLGNGVFRTAGIESKQIADGIEKVLNELRANSPGAQTVENAAGAILDQYDIKKQGDRLMAMARALAGAKRSMRSDHGNDPRRPLRQAI